MQISTIAGVRTPLGKMGQVSSVGLFWFPPKIGRTLFAVGGDVFDEIYLDYGYLQLPTYHTRCFLF